MAGTSNTAKPKGANSKAAKSKTAQGGGKVVPLTRKRRCPVCRKPEAADYRPFCSKRCADLDLGKWLNEDYRIPTEDVPDDFDPEADYPEE